jgi:hypothetical protein
MFLEPSAASVPSESIPMPPPPLKRRRRFPKISIVVVAGILVFLGGCVYVGIAATRVINGSIATRDGLLAAKTNISSAEFADAGTQLTKALAGIAEAKAGADMVSWVSHLPWIGSRYDAAIAVLDATQNTVDVLVEAVSIADDVYGVVAEARETLTWTDPSVADAAVHDLPTSVKRALFTRLANAYPNLQTMQVKLDLASDDIARFHSLPGTEGFADVLTPFEAALADLKNSVDFLVPFAGISREFAGLNGDRQFLLMFMNNTELRPTGGFLGSYGLLVIRDGDMKSLTTDDTYAVDALVANNPDYVSYSPAPIVKYLEQPVWYFRDGTWSPDFAQGAKDTTALFRQEIATAGRPVPQVDGVIGVTTSFMENLLNFVGPVSVDGVTYTAQNAADILEYQVEIAFEQQGVTRENRKDIVGKLTNAVLDKMLEVSPSQFPEVFKLLVDSFAQKELAAYSGESKTQAILDDAHWSGKVEQGTADDVLMVVDANMASLKSDPVVERSIAYSIAPSGSGYRATAAITYKHTGSFDWKTSRYRTYTRLYVPAGTQLISVDGSLANDAIRNPSGAAGEVTTASELGLTSFGTFTSIEPGQSRTLTFVYTLPQSVADAINSGAYTLEILKQIGADPRDVTLNLDFNKNLSDASPAENSSQWGDDVYHLETALDQDVSFRVEF